MKLGVLKKSAVLALFCFSGFFAHAQSGSTSGKDLFSARCVTCHGSDGKGTTLGKQLKALDLNSLQVQRNTNAALKKVISDGKGNMPPFSTVLTDAQITQLLKYVRTFGKKPS
jgi:mono/diheme cytochrome c family protein